MDEDLVGMCVVLGVFLLFPFLVVILTTSCIAYSRTKKWDKDRTLKAAHLESTDTLLDAADDDSDDYVDTDDEDEHRAAKVEAEQDRFLTFNQMWRKEFRKVWNGKGAKQIIKEREREERRKLAKAVAREMDRRERRKARKAAREGQVEAESMPPAYKN